MFKLGLEAGAGSQKTCFNPPASQGHIQEGVALVEGGEGDLGRALEDKQVSARGLGEGSVFQVGGAL